MQEEKTKCTVKCEVSNKKTTMITSKELSLSEEKIVKVWMMEKLHFFSVLKCQNIKSQAKTSKRKPKNYSMRRNVKARAKTSKRESKCQCTSPDEKAPAKTSKHEPKLSKRKRKHEQKVRAKMSKHEPKCQSPSQNIKVRAKTSKRAPKRQSKS